MRKKIFQEKKNESLNFAKSNAHRKTNAGGSFETDFFFFFSLTRVHRKAYHLRNTVLLCDYQIRFVPHHIMQFSLVNNHSSVSIADVDNSKRPLSKTVYKRNCVKKKKKKKKLLPTSTGKTANRNWILALIAFLISNISYCVRLSYSMTHLNAWRRRTEHFISHVRYFVQTTIISASNVFIIINRYKRKAVCSTDLSYHVVLKWKKKKIIKICMLL